MNYAQDRLDRRARDGSVYKDYQIALKNHNHTLLATSLRDVGWNRHALFHYAQAWLLNPTSAGAAGDYAQMAEFAGFPELGAIALGVFRTRKTSSPGAACSENREKVLAKEEVKSDNAEALHETSSWLTGQCPPERNCGCGSRLCGDVLATPFTSTEADEFLNEVDLYLQHTTNGKSQASSAPPPSAYNILSGRDERSLDPAVPSDPTVPDIFRFWVDSREYTPLSVELQLLWTKLWYLICPSLAVHMIIEVKKDRHSFSLAYKSHWAYQTFLSSLVLGARIKPHRIPLLSHYHEPVWNVIHDCTSRRQKKFDKPLEPKPGTQFVNEMRQLCRRTTSETDFPPLNWWLPVHIQHRPLYIVGDSHVLSLSWQTLEIDNEPRLVVPIIVTGLKAWHVQSTTNFFTHSNLHYALQRIDLGIILFSAGEIDCREGLGGPSLEGYSADCKEHLERTVKAYIQGLEGLVSSYDALKHVLVLPIAKHSHRKTGRVEGQVARRETSDAWNRCLDEQLQYSKNVQLLQYIDKLEAQRSSESVRFDADSTHLNAAFAPFLAEAVTRAMEHLR